MAALPGTSLATTLAAGIPAAGRILLVGPEAVAAQGVIEQQLLSSRTTPGEMVTNLKVADSILEVGLFTAEKDGAKVGPVLYVVGVSQELEHLEAGLRTLRRGEPDARIVLLCEPADEVATRKARIWGADDYFILPLDPANARRMLFPERPGKEAEAAARDAKRVALPTGGGAALRRAEEEIMPALPLMVQTELLEDMLTGRGDFAQRAVARLARHVAFHGELRFVAGTSDASDEAPPGTRQIRRAVALPPPLDQPSFGMLILEAEHITPAMTAAVAQAANWLATMLAVAQRHEQLRLMAITDELSGAYNRRYFSKYMSSLLDRAKEKRFRVTLLLFDIDDFKRYNDTFGHASGDSIIRELIRLLRACTRPHDLVARIGGDEFAVVYWDNEAPRQPNSDHPKDALAATERFREAIRNHQWPQTCNIKGEVSISGGLASFPWHGDTLEILMAKADEALLKAKAAGKNVIVMHGVEAPVSLK